jgi:antitoxin component of MazEF toxin-antitoxin module
MSDNEYTLQRRVIKLGTSSFAVTFPRWLAEAKGLKQGDFVLLKFNGRPGIVIEKRSKLREQG